MQDQRTFGAHNQLPPHWGGRSARIRLAGLLDNKNLQMPYHDQIEFIDPPLQASRASSKLEELKRQRFTEEGKPERIARSLAALNQQSSIQLSPEEWKLIAEDPDIEDQF